MSRKVDLGQTDVCHLKLRLRRLKLFANFPVIVVVVNPNHDGRFQGGVYMFICRWTSSKVTLPNESSFWVSKE